MPKRSEKAQYNTHVPIEKHQIVTFQKLEPAEVEWSNYQNVCNQNKSPPLKHKSLIFRE